MIPNSYTYETFADYLKDEVLLAAANELGWIDTVDVFDPVMPIELVGIGNTRLGDGVIVITTAGTGTGKSMLPALFDIPAGTLVNYGSNVYTVAADVKKEDVAITFTTSFNTVKGAKLKYYNAPPPRARNSIYTSIIDETLLKLGISDISSITGRERIKQLRMYGRRECWKAAMQVLVTDYSYQHPGYQSDRREVYEHCKQAYLFEDSRLNLIYGEARTVAETGELRVSTTRQRIRPRW